MGFKSTAVIGKNPIVNVLRKPAFDSYVKVGRTIDLEQRLRQLDNTSVPLPFRCVYAIEVDDEHAVERLVHQALADVRVRTTCEFFEIDAQRIILALKPTNGRDETLKEDIAEDEESIAALESTVAKRKSYSFSDARVNVGDVLCYSKDKKITAIVLGDKKIEFESEDVSVSKAVLTLLHREGYKWKQAKGWAY